MPNVFDIRDLEDLQQTIDRFVSVEFTKAAEKAMTKALLLLHGKLPEYPPPPKPGTASKHWTDKQRKWFFWALSQKLVEVPYRRTLTLGRRFMTRVTRKGVEIFGAIGSDVPYAPWVVGPPEAEAMTFGGVKMFQAPIHQGRWWRFYDVIEAGLDEAYQEFVDVFWERLNQEWTR